jgi:hypothetical protein
LPGPDGPRVSPAQSKVDGGFPRRPLGRNGTTQKRHCVRVGHVDRDFSRPPPTKKLRHKGAPPPSFTAHQQAPPWSCGHHPRRFEIYGVWPVRCWYTTTRASSSAAVREKPTSTAKMLSSTGQSSQDTPDPTGPVGLKRTRKAPIALLQQVGRAAVPIPPE